MATCKQVMHAKEVLFKMKPGLPMMRLHSKMGQHQRMATYDEFCRKERALLIATDLCARGMDFPGVDWVVQVFTQFNTFSHDMGGSTLDYEHWSWVNHNVTQCDTLNVTFGYRSTPVTSPCISPEPNVSL